MKKKLIDSIVSLGIKNKFIHGSGGQSSSREMVNLQLIKLLKNLKKIKIIFK